MPSFPLVSPESFGIAQVQWSAISNDAYTRNLWNFALIKQIFDGRMWRGSLTVRAKKGSDGRPLTAWLTSLRRAGTNAGTFMLGNPAAALPLGSAKDTPGTPIVDGGGQTGEAFNVSGLPTSVTGYLLEGDYIQLGTGIAARLKMVLDDVDSDGSGDAVMNLWPPVRVAPSNGTTVKVSNAQGLFISPNGTSSWSIRPPATYEGINIEVEEVL